MLKELKFVQGAVAKKDLMPALTHFAIENGTVRGYNGIIALCSPIAYDIQCKPKALPLVKAISLCNDVVQLHLTEKGRLSIKSGKFRALIDCIEGPTPHVLAEGEPFEIDGVKILEAFKKIFPIVGTDASRPWCEGILLKDQSAFATNNIILVEYWLGCNIPFPINIPKLAIAEMLRIGEPPGSALIKDNAISFLYSGDRWIRTQLYGTEWPDVSYILDKESNYTAIDPELFIGLENLKSFCDDLGRVYFTEDGVKTSLSEEGASYHIDNHPNKGIFNLSMLQLLDGIAKSIDWTNYPKPCSFIGDNLRGVIVGLK